MKRAKPPPEHRENYRPLSKILTMVGIALMALIPISVLLFLATHVLPKFAR